MSLEEFTKQLNDWGREAVPFLFVVDFELKKPVAMRLDEVDASKILFEVNGIGNVQPEPGTSTPVLNEIIRKKPITAGEYEQKFKTVSAHLAYGDSFLTNLTIDTEVQLSHSLRDIFFISKARYKIFFDNQFLVFSPETFVQIREGKIFSYPMKGTIDADVPDAERKIMTDRKELAEHITIVDLIRNDVSQVAQHVTVNRFRYIDRIKTNEKTLLQVSSEIVGILPPDYTARLGEIIVALLPAGSVSGAPKPKTLEVIREAEGGERGYYTGVFGLYDGTRLDSGVMIRFIEKKGDKFFYRSGGGITTQSLFQTEYQEAIDKVYVPVG